ncbi:hypothetical protein PPERSA_03837 [Pseudocohnilembus persalinus]|uniref:Fe2OG dioxygenase domain-containing protein n=1 Tax=Pseudocohnilembus persalinus TaxID=266149 RepID=A0A0V0QU85_PSEPJ|nr:hypothetical protein PPERSA_03837 [Pseudocohnilembus persalinus]|eukprot:KRX05900.1 hypothetical protein PPERSA_03837 [Pseudocohnilembus persalinus]
MENINEKTQNKDYTAYILEKCNLQVEEHPQIKGLLSIKDFITKEEEKILIENIEKENWDDVLKRRTMQFGVFYNQAKKWIEQKKRPYPNYFNFLFKRLKTYNLIDYDENNANTLINEYYPGQTLYHHKDVFGEIILGLNMLADCDLQFINDQNKQVINVQQPRRSLYIMTGDSRYIWKHGIMEVKKRRISLTVRSTVPNPQKFPNLIIKN